MKKTVVSENTLSVWRKWIDVTRSRCHLHFKLEGETVEEHIAACRENSRVTVTRIVKDLPNNFRPRHILEVGASVGFNSIALAERFENVEVHSIEPDAEAVQVALAMTDDLGLSYKPVVGFGEKLDYPDNYFDLIICHQVIEHVNNVEKAISEMARVLSKDGFIHLEAPNYLWLYEPHLHVWCVPKLGKPLLRLTSWLQGKGRDNWYINHLNFVSPGILQRHFKKYGLRWHNRVIDKLHTVAKGNLEGIKKYRLIAKLLSVLQRVGVTSLLIPVIGTLRIYPSLMYTIRKTSHDR